MSGTIRSLALLLALSAGGGPASAVDLPAGVALHNCPREIVERVDPGPVSAGPLRLESVACPDFGSSPFSASDPILAPDGSAAARWHAGVPAPIEIAGIGGPGRIEIPNRVTFRGLAFHGPPGSPEALAWSDDSRSLLTVRQALATPGGFARSGLEPIAIDRDGRVRPLPALRHPAGPLDGLQWVGGKGLALALFGARGGFYRPEHAIPTLLWRRSTQPAAACSTHLPRAESRSSLGGSKRTAS